jgi:hypothetical protein
MEIPTFIKEFILFFTLPIIFSGHQIHQGRDIEQSDEKRYDKSSDEPYRHRSEQFIFHGKDKQSDDCRHFRQKYRDEPLSNALLETIDNRKSFIFIIIFEIFQMDQCLIDSYPHHSEDSYHRRKGKIISRQSKNDYSSSYRQKHTRNDNNSIFDIIELDNQDKDHKDKSDKHSFA